MKKKLSHEAIIGLIVLLTVVLPLLAVVVGVFLFRTTPFEHMPFKVKMRELTSQVAVTSEEKVVKPSEVLANKAKYANRKLIVRGKILEDKVVCERRTCPANDSCCGCPPKKNLVIADADLPFLSDVSRELPIFGPEEEPLCTRKQGSCDYDCPGWQLGGVFDVEGTFLAEAPIAGSGIQLWQFHLEVISQRPAPKTETSSFLEEIKGNIQEIIKQLRTSGYYVR